jgi:hypothetical protein
LEAQGPQERKDNKDNIKTIGGADAPPSRQRRPDQAYEIFCSEFAGHRGVPYRGTKGDFVQLAGLRQALRCDGGGIPGDWSRAIRNYFATPQGRYTLGDLCSRYDVFLRGPLDRFGRPVEQQQGGSNGASSGVRSGSGQAHQRKPFEGAPAYIVGSGK